MTLDHWEDDMLAESRRTPRRSCSMLALARRLPSPAGPLARAQGSSTSERPPSHGSSCLWTHRSGQTAAGHKLRMLQQWLPLGNSFSDKPDLHFRKCSQRRNGLQVVPSTRLNAPSPCPSKRPSPPAPLPMERGGEIIPPAAGFPALSLIQIPEHVQHLRDRHVERGPVETRTRRNLRESFCECCRDVGGGSHRQSSAGRFRR